MGPDWTKLSDTGAGVRNGKEIHNNQWVKSIRRFLEGLMILVINIKDK
jgi:hypothetical protein